MIQQTLAAGQLAATATVLTANKISGKVNILLQNVGGQGETVTLSLLPAGGTSRRIGRWVLSANEQIEVQGLALDGDDILKGVATDAASVDYVIQSAPETSTYATRSYDSNGALKIAQPGSAGNISVSGDIVVGGGDIDLGSSGQVGTVDIFPSTVLSGKTRITAADNAGDTTTTITNRSQAAARTFTLPDPGASADFQMLVGAQSAIGAATSMNRMLFKKTGIADNTATDILTITVPNAAHAAMVKVTMLSSNGSTDAFESSRCAEGLVVLTRIAGDVVVPVAATLALAQIATDATGGAATHTLAYAVSTITGAGNAVNTFTITVTINDTGNLGSNQVVVLAELVNAEASGVTMATA